MTFYVCSHKTLQRRRRGDKPPTDEEMSSALINKPPGAPPLTVLSFSRAFHGRTMGMSILWFIFIFKTTPNK